jgi:hypothetical protein
MQILCCQLLPNDGYYQGEALGFMLSPCTPLVHNPFEPHYDHGWSDITIVRLINSQDINKVCIYIYI